MLKSHCRPVYSAWSWTRLVGFFWACTSDKSENPIFADEQAASSRSEMRFYKLLRNIARTESRTVAASRNMTLNVTSYNRGGTTKLSEGHKFAAWLQDVHKRLATFRTIYECPNEFINVKFKRLCGRTHGIRSRARNISLSLFIFYEHDLINEQFVYFLYFSKSNNLSAYPR